MRVSPVLRALGSRRVKASRRAKGSALPVSSSLMNDVKHRLFDPSYDLALAQQLRGQDSIAALKKAARRGSLDAVEQLGITFDESGNRKEAFSWHFTAAQRGSASSSYRVAQLLREYKKTDDSALYYLRKAAQGGHFEAQLSVALHELRHELPRLQGDAKAGARVVDVLQRAEQSAEAQFALAELRANGTLVARDEQVARLHLERAAQLGNADALWRIAQLDGEQSEQAVRLGSRLAREHLLSTIEQHSAELLFEAAMSASKQSEHNDAMILLRAASQRGHVQSQIEFARYLLKSSDPDITLPLNLLRHAALSSVEANLMLAELHDRGDRVNRSARQALKYTKRAAELGSVDAMFLVAQRYKAKGEFSDEIEWLRRASQHNHERAQMTLAHYHRTGYQDVLPQDRKQMLHYFKLAAAQGNRMALANIERSNE
jgi:TPR repeat protein